MKILHLSDTHGLHKNLRSLPEADVIVHSGDFTFAGSEEEAYDFMNWFRNLPYEHKVFIAGNHDMCMYGADPIEGLSPNVHYLYNNSIVIDGMNQFWRNQMLALELESRAVFADVFFSVVTHPEKYVPRQNHE